MSRPPVCLASDWEPDRSFVEALESRLHGFGRDTFVVWPDNLDETVAAIRRGELRFSFLVDRASNTSPEFLALTAPLVEAAVPCLDTPQAMAWTADKATMHLEFLQAGIEVPHTVILDPVARRTGFPEVEAEIGVLGVPFVVKPANTTGGGIGVFDGASGWPDIERVRLLYPEDKYLVQQRVRPLERDGRRFWFRVFYACGDVHCCWWDDRSHVYAAVSRQERERYGLGRLEAVLRCIAQVCRLKLFSSEMVDTPEGRVVVVDYVNETPDLRPQSAFPDGVPDGVVGAIADVVALHIHGALGPP